MNGKNKNKKEDEKECADIEEALIQTPNPKLLTPGDRNPKTEDLENGGYRFTPRLRRRMMAVAALSDQKQNIIKEKLSKEIQKPNTSKKLDRISRILFPMMFALYNIGYFLRYMTNKDFFSENM